MFFLLPKITLVLLLVFGILLLVRIGRQQKAGSFGRWLGRRWASRKNRSGP